MANSKAVVLGSKGGVMGRPSKLTAQVISIAWDYVNKSNETSPDTPIPTIERLALILDIHTDTLQDWSKNDDDFSAILRRLRQIQADKLLQNGLIGKYNPVITKLMLSKHGYIERSEQDQHINLVQPIVGGLAKAEIEDAEDESL